MQHTPVLALFLVSEIVSSAGAACDVTAVVDSISKLDKDLASGVREVSAFNKFTLEGLNELDPSELSPAPAVSEQGDRTLYFRTKFVNIDEITRNL